MLIKKITTSCINILVRYICTNLRIFTAELYKETCYAIIYILSHKAY
jgi:hypothetical protein